MHDDSRPHDDDSRPAEDDAAAEAPAAGATGVPHPAAAQPADAAPVDSQAAGEPDDVELDPASDATPEDAVASQLRDALGQLRGEADRIAELGTGQEQVEAAERFAEDAGRLDEQLGAAARASDADGNR